MYEVYVQDNTIGHGAQIHKTIENIDLEMG